MKINHSAIGRWSIYLVAATAIAAGLAWGAAQRPRAEAKHEGCGAMMAPAATDGGCDMDPSECARHMPAADCQKKMGGEAPRPTAEGQQAARCDAGCTMDRSECAEHMAAGDCEKKMGGKAAAGGGETTGAPPANAEHGCCPATGSAQAGERAAGGDARTPKRSPDGRGTHGGCGAHPTQSGEDGGQGCCPEHGGAEPAESPGGSTAPATDPQT